MGAEVCERSRRRYMWPHPRQLRTVRHVRAPPGREKRSEETEPWLPAIFQEPVMSLCRPVSPTPGKKRCCRPSFEKWPRCYDARLASRRTGCRGAPVAVTSWCREDRSFQNLSSAFASDISVFTKCWFCSFASASLLPRRLTQGGPAGEAQQRPTSRGPQASEDSFPCPAEIWQRVGSGEGGTGALGTPESSARVHVGASPATATTRCCVLK